MYICLFTYLFSAKYFLLYCFYLAGFLFCSLYLVYPHLHGDEVVVVIDLILFDHMTAFAQGSTFGVVANVKY